MSMLKDCQEQFKTDDLYEVFQIDKNAPLASVKKSYYKLSMLYHPDKAENNDHAKKVATVRFQLVTKIYSILSDKEKRKIYDETGAIDEEGNITDEDSIKLWRKVFKKVTKEDIDKFFADYKGSEEERSDIANAYNKCDGNMDVMLEYIMLSSSDEESRVKEIVDQLIKDGTLKATKKYKSSTGKAKTNARAKKAAKEAEEAEEMLKEIKKKEGTDDLQALILKRQANRGRDANSFLDSLADKYAPKTKRSKK